MKTYSKLSVAKGQAAKAAKINKSITWVQDGEVFLVGEFDEITAYITEREAGATAKVAAARKSPKITVLFPFAGSDEKYVKVAVGHRIYKIGKRMIDWVLQGDQVQVTMSEKYAATRPELNTGC